LLYRALFKVHADESQPLLLKTLVVAFLEEHKFSRFTFKCRPCHAQETAELRKERSARKKSKGAETGLVGQRVPLIVIQQMLLNATR
jgi:hypothetical protein